MRNPPEAAVLVEAFANTLDIHAGTDALTTPDELATWLTARDLLADAAPRPDPALHALSLALRAGIRAQLGAHVGYTPEPALLTRADEALRRLPVRIAADGSLSPAPGLPPAARALAALAIAWSELVTTGDAARLKCCAEHTCGEAFWDVSKNRSRRWCSMQSCGNRAKARSYAARQSGQT